MSLRFETVAAETLDPQRISETSSILLVETLTRYISTIASSTVSLTSSRRSDLRLSSFNAAMGSGMADLQYASCLDNLNHTEACRALPSIWTLFCCQSAQENERCHATPRATCAPPVRLRAAGAT